jgi:hypothetical protein
VDRPVTLVDFTIAYLIVVAVIIVAAALANFVYASVKLYRSYHDDD